VWILDSEWSFCFGQIVHYKGPSEKSRAKMQYWIIVKGSFLDTSQKIIMIIGIWFCVILIALQYANNKSMYGHMEKWVLGLVRRIPAFEIVQIKSIENRAFFWWGVLSQVSWRLRLGYFLSFAYFTRKFDLFWT
jgi:hypothetical protein